MYKIKTKLTTTQLAHVKTHCKDSEVIVNGKEVEIISDVWGMQKVVKCLTNSNLEHEVTKVRVDEITDSVLQSQPGLFNSDWVRKTAGDEGKL